MTDLSHQEPPRKRARLDEADRDEADRAEAGSRDALQREQKAKITAFVNPSLPGFSGIFKQRYSDFLVNEILPNGHVLHLEYEEDMTTPAKQQTETIPDDGAASSPNPDATTAAEEHTDEVAGNDKEALIEIFGESVANSIIKLYGALLKHPHRKKKDFKLITSETIPDKDRRAKAHMLVRRVFKSLLETSTGENNDIAITVAPPSARRHANGTGARNAFPGHSRGDAADLGGNWLHFTMLKENRDTMEVIVHLSSQLKCQPRRFNFAGTKDRRGITVQRVSVQKVHRDRMKALSRTLRNARVGDFEYSNAPLALGQLQGNEFGITLRDCHFPNEDGLSFAERKSLAETIVKEAAESLQSRGFINYYGLQRFGSFQVTTDQVGKKLLRGDFKGAVALILDYPAAALAAARGEAVGESITTDDRGRAMALHKWEETGNAQEALDLMPKKFSGEASIIRFLGQTKGGRKVHSADYQGAFMTVQRGLRLMYVHAYQSLVWNAMAGARWEKYGDRVVEGDLVIVPPRQRQESEPEVDADGEVIVQPASHDRAAVTGDFVRARPLSKEEAESGDYSIWDVVLPQPGWDVVYPKNCIGKMYEEFMGSEEGGGLNPHDMRRKVKDVSLSGGYRKLLARPADMRWEVKGYDDDAEQLVETDLDRIAKQSGAVVENAVQDRNDEPAKLAVVLRLQLGSSQYATMALREMLRHGGVRPYKAEIID